MIDDPEDGRVQSGSGDTDAGTVLPVAPLPLGGVAAVGGNLSAASGGITQPAGGLALAAGVAHPVTTLDDADGRLARRVEEALAADGRVQSAGVTVVVTEGMVELSGSVATERERQTAEDICAATSGVRAVRNGLTVSG